MGVDAPLPVLLSRVLAARTAVLEASLEVGAAASCSLAVWSNVVRPVADGASDERSLAVLGRLSKRMAVAAVTGAKRRGWLEVGPAVERGGGRVVALTAAGAAADRSWRRLLVDRPSGGDDAVLRAALEPVVAGLVLELPWFPASYGTADPSVVGGSSVAGDPDRGIPSHGQDWKPVLRGDSTSDLPITALLSQALVGFTIDYEATPRWPLASTALVVRHLRRTPVALSVLPPGHGIAGNGRSLLERHGIAVVDGGMVSLTARGEAIRAAHEHTLAAVEARWCEVHGSAAIDELRSALAAEPAAGDETLPDHVVAPLELG